MNTNPSTGRPALSGGAEIITFLKQRALRLATAESCTAGLIASSLADLPGAGDVLECAFVVYSPLAKQRLLGVNAGTIERYNLTSEAVAREMAHGALRLCHAELVIANTGVADAVDDHVPAGTQCFAWAFRGVGMHDTVMFSETRRFSGERNQIRQASAEYALQRIFDHCAAVDRRR